MSNSKRLHQAEELAKNFPETVKAIQAAESAAMDFCVKFHQWMQDIVPVYLNDPFFLRELKDGENGILLYSSDKHDQSYYLCIDDDTVNKWLVWDSGNDCCIGEATHGTTLRAAYQFVYACENGLLGSITGFFDLCGSDQSDAIKRALTIMRPVSGGY
jgi:hypothetical protein